VSARVSERAIRAGGAAQISRHSNRIPNGCTSPSKTARCLRNWCFIFTRINGGRSICNMAYASIIGHLLRCIFRDVVPKSGGSGSFLRSGDRPYFFCSALQTARARDWQYLKHSLPFLATSPVGRWLYRRQDHQRYRTQLFTGRAFQRYNIETCRRCHHRIRTSLNQHTAWPRPQI